MIFAISPIIQKEETDRYCLGRCKKVIIAGIDMGEWGCFIPCREVDCEFEDKISPVIGEAFGDDVCVRKLMDITSS